jgi:hypothetical protein
VNTPPVWKLASSEAIAQRDATDIEANMAVPQRFLTFRRSTCDYGRVVEGAAVEYIDLLWAEADLRLYASQAKKIVSRIACSFDEGRPVPVVRAYTGSKGPK